jgi:Ca2+-dependent lipid-binding protein
VKGATELKDVDAFGKQDPYCIITCGKLQHKSKTHTDGGRNPVWGEKFLIPNVTAEHVLKLEVRIMLLLSIYPTAEQVIMPTSFSRSSLMQT